MSPIYTSTTNDVILYHDNYNFISDVNVAVCCWHASDYFVFLSFSLLKYMKIWLVNIAFILK